MRWFVRLLILSSAAFCLPAYSQLSPGGPSGDFRVDERSGTAPTAGPPGGPSPAPNPTMFRDSFGPKSPDEVLKSIDKDLGRSTLERAGGSPPPVDLEKDLRSLSDKYK